MDPQAYAVHIITAGKSSLDGIFTGPREAIERIYEQYRPSAVRIVPYVLADGEPATDANQLLDKRARALMRRMEMESLISEIYMETGLLEPLAPRQPCKHETFSPRRSRS